MSSNLAYALPVRRPVDEGVEEHPRSVRALAPRASRRTRPKLAYALVAITVIFGIFLAQLLLSISLSSGAYNIARLQNQQRDLTRTASALDERLNTMGSTQNLAANAHALGMVASSSFAFLRISDGKVIGHANPANHGTAKTKLTGANGTVPNFLLTDVPVIQQSASGHGASNTANSALGDSQSNSSGGSTDSSSKGSTHHDSSKNSSTGQGSSTGDSAQHVVPGELPSPQTH